MRSFVLFLLLAGAAMGIPLHLGETWTWELRGRFDGQSGYRTAKVIATKTSGKQTIWTLGVRDSAAGSEDTGIILSDSDGHQRWTRYTTLLPWEPEPWTGWVGEWRPMFSDIYFRDTGTPPWGKAICCASANHSPNQRRSEERGYEFLITLDQAMWPIYFIRGSAGLVNGTPTEISADLPQEIRDDTLGLLRIRLPAPKGITDWHLVSHNGRSLPVPPIKLSLPDSGETRIWKTQWGPFAHNSAFERWEILSRPPDSANWARARIRKMSHDFFQHSWDFVSEYRWNRTTGEQVPQGPDLADAWISDWTDTMVPDGRVRHYEDFVQGMTPGSRQVREWIRNGEWDSGSIHGYEVRLIERNGVRIRPDIDPQEFTLAQRSAKDRGVAGELQSIQGFRQELSAAPGSAIRLTELSGRYRIYSASEAIVALENRHGLVLVEVDDGARRSSGRLLLP